MTRFLPLILACCLIVLSITSLPKNAKADYFVVQDPEFGYTFSVPDRWYRLGGMSSRVDYAFMSPQLDGQKDYAGCAIFSDRDKRFLVANARELDHYVGREFDVDYFGRIIPRLNIGRNDAINISILGINPGGLGDGFARYSILDYTAMSGVEKRALVFATLYGDMQMAISCQSKKTTFDRRLPEFMSVISSLDFENFYRSYPSFYYRDFLGTDKTLFRIWIDDVFSDIKEGTNKFVDENF